MQEARELLGKVAIVTGAGRGIERAIARALGDKGAKVVVVARTLSEIEETAGLLAEKGQQALAFPADVTDPCAVKEVVKRTLKELGGIDILACVTAKW